MGSTINGRYLGEPEFGPFLEAAAALDLAIFVHALHPLQARHLSTFPELVPLAGFVSDTGLCAATIIMSGILERLELRIALSHGGGTLAPFVHRMNHGWRTTSGFEGRLARSPRETASRFYLDSIVYDAGYARYLAALAPDRVCLGTDYPYLIEQKQPRAFVDQIATSADDPIWKAAARRFLAL